MRRVTVKFPTIEGPMKKELDVVTMILGLAGVNGDTAHTFKPPTTEVVFDRISAGKAITTEWVPDVREYVKQFGGTVHVEKNA